MILLLLLLRLQQQQLLLLLLLLVMIIVILIIIHQAGPRSWIGARWALNHAPMMSSSDNGPDSLRRYRWTCTCTKHGATALFTHHVLLLLHDAQRFCACHGHKQSRNRHIITRICRPALHRHAKQDGRDPGQGPLRETPPPEIRLNTFNKTELQWVSSVLCVFSKCLQLTNPIWIDQTWLLGVVSLCAAPTGQCAPRALIPVYFCSIASY